MKKIFGNLKLPNELDIKFDEKNSSGAEDEILRSKRRRIKRRWNSLIIKTNFSNKLRKQQLALKQNRNRLRCTKDWFTDNVCDAKKEDFFLFLNLPFCQLRCWIDNSHSFKIPRYVLAYRLIQFLFCKYLKTPFEIVMIQCL